ncbi:hypothetical protein CCR75_005577 [Bremia lactucae]|uniref:Uncharacterized protein n=1 Tax=Bremia lactucae TaxID=4779 RepID=A0A976IBM7_BRELC|nr:hypothetical protein CCR75_005577 [Bremia lactucae]
MAENVASTVRICVTRCPLQSAEENVHSLPCRIHFDGSAAIKSFFQPQTSDCKSNSTDLGGLSSDEQDIDMDKNQESGNTSEKNKLIAEFRGIQLHGENLSLPHLGFTGLVLEDSGMRHPTDEGRVWEVEDYFDQIMWWDVPNRTITEAQQLPQVLQQWRTLSSAVSTVVTYCFCVKTCAADNRPSIVILTGECVG